MTTCLSLVPTTPDMVSVVNSLLDRAHKQVASRYKGNIKDNSPAIAEVTQAMLALSVQEGRAQRVAQGFVVAYVVREGLAQFHPSGYRNLREFLRGAGLAESTVSTLNALEKIVPFCDVNGMNLDKLLTIEHWSKLEAAIPALRRAERDQDVNAAREILTVVETTKARESVRNQYRNRHARYGHGTTMQLSDGRVLLVGLLDDEEASAIILRRLDGALEWDLSLGYNVTGGALKVVVQNA